MKKKDVQKHEPGSIAHVLAHSIYQKSRGRNPSVTYEGIRNPRKAIVEAMMDAEMHILFLETIEEHEKVKT